MALALLGVGVLGAGSWLAATGSSGTAPTVPGTLAGLASPNVTSPTAGGKATSATSLVATVLSPARKYASPGHPSPGLVLPTWEYRPSVLPVISQRPGWVQVRLAQRPNGSTTWLRSSDVTLGVTPYRIVINTATMHLSLYELGNMVFSAPAGIGTTTDPTPSGEYFVAFRRAATAA